MTHEYIPHPFVINRLEYLCTELSMRNQRTLHTVYTLDFAKSYKTYKKWKIVLFICWVLDTQLGDRIFLRRSILYIGLGCIFHEML